MASRKRASEGNLLHILNTTFISTVRKGHNQSWYLPLTNLEQTFLRDIFLVKTALTENFVAYSSCKKMNLFRKIEVVLVFKPICSKGS